MKKSLLTVFCLLILSSCNDRHGDSTKPCTLTTPTLQQVTLDDRFWSPVIERNREITIPYIFGKCEETGRIDNFAIAGGLKRGHFTGERYNDSDVFKIIEAACYSLAETPDPELQHYVDSLVNLIAGAQEDDGYLYTTRTIDSANMAPGAGNERWADERVSHELYNVGHMYEAAVAHYMLTGSDKFLNVALKNAALVSQEFGWGMREIAPGHQEIELGLIKLYRVTGDKRWLDLAKFFLDVRGRGEKYTRHPAGSRFEVYNDSLYLQMHKPVLEQETAVGHAVRGAYMYTAMAELSEASGDPDYLRASGRIWEDVISGKIYITGGIGSREYGEAFGEPSELPNMTAYTETCASVANLFWNHALYSGTGDGRYLDVLERTLYNGLLSGVGNDGSSFFYTNPLESDGSFERAGWFVCSCCPGNIARLLPQLKQYIWSVTPEGINVNLFIGSAADLMTPAGEVKVDLKTTVPWSGDVTIVVSPVNGTGKFTVGLRIPAWTGEAPMEGDLYSYLTPPGSNVKVSVNNKNFRVRTEEGFMKIKREWKQNDTIRLMLPVNPRFLTARDNVRSDTGRVAIGAGPLIYCLEETDNGPVRNLRVKADQVPVLQYDSTLLGGVGVIKFRATDSDGNEREVKAIPYYAWANRGLGEMIVWIKRDK